MHSLTPEQTLALLERCAQLRTAQYDEFRPDVLLAIYAPSKHWDNLWLVASDPEHRFVGHGETLQAALVDFARVMEFPLSSL